MAHLIKASSGNLLGPHQKAFTGVHTTLFGFLNITCEAGSRSQRHKLQQL